MSRKKKRNENSSSGQGLHLKSTPKGYHVPQYVPRVLTPRFKPRRRYWRRRYSRSWRGRRSPLPLIIALFVIFFVLLCVGIDKLWTFGANQLAGAKQDKKQEIVMTSNLVGMNSPPSEVKQPSKTPKKVQKKHKIEVDTETSEDNQTTAEEEKSKPETFDDNVEEKNASEDSVLFDELFNKALSGADKSQQSRQPRYIKPRIQQNFVPSASWSPGNLERHWAKHGAEFPEYSNETEYGNGALYFFARPPPGTLRKHRDNGDRLYYHPSSNTFGVTTGDGTPKTMFRPRDGMRYWERQ